MARVNGYSQPTLLPSNVQSVFRKVPYFCLGTYSSVVVTDPTGHRPRLVSFLLFHHLPSVFLEKPPEQQDQKWKKQVRKTRLKHSNRRHSVQSQSERFDISRSLASGPSPNGFEWDVWGSDLEMMFTSQPMGMCPLSQIVWGIPSLPSPLLALPRWVR